MSPKPQDGNGNIITIFGLGLRVTIFIIRHKSVGIPLTPLVSAPQLHAACWKPKAPTNRSPHQAPARAAGAKSQLPGGVGVLKPTPCFRAFRVLGFRGLGFRGLGFRVLGFGFWGLVVPGEGCTCWAPWRVSIGFFLVA